MRSLAVTSFLPCLALAAFAASGALVACGGDGGTSGPTDASTPANPDATATDASPVSQTDGPTDAPVGSPTCTSSDAGSCRACCATAYASGFREFARLALPCACTASLCGPLEAGDADVDGGPGDAPGAAIDAGPSDATSAATDGASGDAGAAATGDGDEDAGPFGQGACSATCSQQAPVDTGCITCITQTLGRAKSLGPCVDTLEQCAGDPTCLPFITCVTSCK
jgi:hypothetical protein